MPVLDASGEGLTACRRLSESLRQVAKDRDALFLDVDEVVRRHLGGTAQPIPCSSAGTQRLCEHSAPALAVSQVEPASGGIALVAAATSEAWQALSAANVAAASAVAAAAAGESSAAAEAIMAVKTSLDVATAAAAAAANTAAVAANTAAAATTTTTTTTAAAAATTTTTTSDDWISGWVAGRPPPVYPRRPQDAVKGVRP